MNFVGTAGIELKDTKFNSLRERIRDWVRIDAELQHSMHEEGPSEEIFTSLNRLWTIAIVFSMDFFIDQKGQIRSLEPRKTIFWSWTPWRRWWAKAKQQGRGKQYSASDVAVTYMPRKPGETLHDLEEDLSKMLAELRSQTQSVINEKDARNDSENRRFLEERKRSGSNRSLFCLLRFCILSTPYRYIRFNYLVVDFYAKRISGLVCLLLTN
jgi:hypothetical protein